MHLHETILAPQLPGLAHSHARNVGPGRLVASALCLRSVFVNSTLVPQLLLVGFWVRSFVVQPRELVEGRAKVMTKNYN